MTQREFCDAKRIRARRASSKRNLIDHPSNLPPKKKQKQRHTEDNPHENANSRRYRIPHERNPRRQEQSHHQEPMEGRRDHPAERPMTSDRPPQKEDEEDRPVSLFKMRSYRKRRMKTIIDNKKQFQKAERVHKKPEKWEEMDKAGETDPGWREPSDSPDKRSRPDPLSRRRSPPRDLVDPTQAESDATEDVILTSATVTIIDGFEFVSAKEPNIPDEKSDSKVKEARNDKINEKRNFRDPIAPKKKKKMDPIPTTKKQTKKNKMVIKGRIKFEQSSAPGIKTIIAEPCVKEEKKSHHLPGVCTFCNSGVQYRDLRDHQRRDCKPYKTQHGIADRPKRKAKRLWCPCRGKMKKGERVPCSGKFKKIADRTVRQHLQKYGKLTDAEFSQLVLPLPPRK